MPTDVLYLSDCNIFVSGLYVSFDHSLFMFEHTKPFCNAPRSSYLPITKTHLYNFDPLKPLFYIVKLRFTRVTLFFCFC